MNYPIGRAFGECDFMADDEHRRRILNDPPGRDEAGSPSPAWRLEGAGIGRTGVGVVLFSAGGRHGAWRPGTLRLQQTEVDMSYDIATGTQSRWEQGVIASSRGACSRRCGESSVGNPYLRRDWLPAATGQNPSTWFNNCDSWWRGWDEEDARRRELQAALAIATRPERSARLRRDRVTTTAQAHR